MRLREILLLVVYGCSAAGLVLFGLWAVVAIGIVMAAYSIGTPYVHEVEPGPDRTISLVRRVDLGGGATVAAVSHVALVGDSFDREVKLGSFSDGGWSKGDGWRHSGSVNVCMLRYRFDEDEPQSPQVVALTDSTGTPTAIVVSQNCPPEMLSQPESKTP
jgi:hypothetical protein